MRGKRYTTEKEIRILREADAGIHCKSEAHPELGYPKITRLLKRDDWEVGKRLFKSVADDR